MPVVVTGASGLVGPHAVSAFRHTSPEVRAYVRRPEAAGPLRELGAKVAVGELSDVETLALVMKGAHTVCHLAGGLDLPTSAAFEEANLATTRFALEAALRAGIELFLFLSFPGASPVERNAYLRTKGLAEEAVANSGIGHVIIRSNHVYGRGGRWLQSLRKLVRLRPAVVVGSGRQVLAPVAVEDLAAVLAAADDRQGIEPGVRGLDGPERVTADQLADLIAGKRRVKVHLPPERAARLSRLAGPPFPR